jgi:hypothetical protein
MKYLDSINFNNVLKIEPEWPKLLPFSPKQTGGQHLQGCSPPLSKAASQPHTPTPQH